MSRARLRQVDLSHACATLIARSRAVQRGTCACKEAVCVSFAAYRAKLFVILYMMMINIIARQYIVHNYMIILLFGISKFL